MLKHSAIKSIENQLKFLELHKSNLIIDADTHISDIENLEPVFKAKLNSTPEYYHGRPISAELLIKEMKMAGVDMALTWQNPAVTLYTNNYISNFNALLAANRYIYESALKYPENLIPAGWTDPKAMGIELAKKMVDYCIGDFGFAIVKMNPAQNSFPIDSELSIGIFDYIIEKGAIPAFHFGADTEYTPAKGMENMAKRCFPHPVIGVHMGGGGAGYPDAEKLYNDARTLGMNCTNIYFVESAKRDTHIESDLITYTLSGEPFCKQIFCGSDAPYGRMTWNFGGYRSMFQSLVKGDNHTDPRLKGKNGLFSKEIIQGYMGSNLAELVIAQYRKMLESINTKKMNCPEIIQDQDKIING